MMMMLLVLIAMIACIRAKGIQVENMPKGVMWCGASHLLNFTYSAKDVPDGSQLRIVLSLDKAGENKVLADLGTVVAPVKEFNIVLPQPLPAEWVGKDKLSDNTGGSSTVIFEVIRADKTDVNSYCGLICFDPDFTLKCCPASDAAKCGCDKCSCSSGDVCAAGLECNGSGKCQIDLPGAGQPCPMDMCEGRHKCQCPASNPTCQPADKVCVDTGCAVGMPALPGKLNCPCSNPGGTCEAGLACQNYFCKAASNTPIAQASCSPSTDSKSPDLCMTHPAGSSAAMPYSCQGGMCKPCAVGDRFCLCNAGVCKNTADFCTQAGAAPRCFPRTDCLGCPCGPNGSCSEGGTICISNTCVRPNTVAPTTAPVNNGQSTTVSCSQMPGHEGCPCLMQDGKTGCGKSGLVCKKDSGTCELPGSSSTVQLAIAAVSAALVVAAMF